MVHETIHGSHVFAKIKQGRKSFEGHVIPSTYMFIKSLLT